MEEIESMMPVKSIKEVQSIKEVAQRTLKIMLFQILTDIAGYLYSLNIL